MAEYEIIFEEAIDYSSVVERALKQGYIYYNDDLVGMRKVTTFSLMYVKIIGEFSLRCMKRMDRWVYLLVKNYKKTWWLREDKSE